MNPEPSDHQDLSQIEEEEPDQPETQDDGEDVDGGQHDYGS